MLVEEGFDVVSIDASDKMLKYALKERWSRRKEPGFDTWSKTYFFSFVWRYFVVWSFIIRKQIVIEIVPFFFYFGLILARFFVEFCYFSVQSWHIWPKFRQSFLWTRNKQTQNIETPPVIEEANWLTLYDDIEHLIGGGFDAVICMGNSFAHMLDTIGDQREQQLALNNFERCVKPGGLLLIDHRNYDNIMESGQTPSKSIYYNVSPTDRLWLICDSFHPIKIVEFSLSHGEKMCSLTKEKNLLQTQHDFLWQRSEKKTLWITQWFIRNVAKKIAQFKVDFLSCTGRWFHIFFLIPHSLSCTERFFLRILITNHFDSICSSTHRSSLLLSSHSIAPSTSRVTFHLHNLSSNAMRIYSIQTMIISFLLHYYFADISIRHTQSKHMTDIKTSVLYVAGQPSIITLDYVINANNESSEFRLSYYPHKLKVFSQMLAKCFGTQAKHQIYGDFKQLNDLNTTPAFYIHVLEKN